MLKKTVTPDGRSTGSGRRFLGIRTFFSKGSDFMTVSSGIMARAFLMRTPTLDGECELLSFSENSEKISSHDQIWRFSANDTARLGTEEFVISLFPVKVPDRGDIA
ncbi:MAG: hypothetical protein ABSA46_01545 [Thermodesulfovibrionales bacterium]|jgi:hypothetical protein